MNEAKLVQAAAACSDDAFEALMLTHAAVLRLIASKYADSQEDREDLEAEVTQLLLEDGKRRLDIWKPIAPFAAYLTTVAQRHCLRWCERRNRRLQRERPALSSTRSDRAPEHPLSDLVSAPPEERPDAQALAHEVSASLESLLAKLSDDDQMILRMRFIEGLQPRQIAPVLDISRNAVNQRVFRALRRLRNTLDRDAGDLWEVLYDAV